MQSAISSKLFTSDRVGSNIGDMYARTALAHVSPVAVMDLCQGERIGQGNDLRPGLVIVVIIEKFLS
jgi:hypothetical protein